MPSIEWRLTAFVTQRQTGIGPFDCCPPLVVPGKPIAPDAYIFNIIHVGSEPPEAKAAHVFLPLHFLAQVRKKAVRSPDFHLV
jgi:hypothetical protein